MADLIDTRMPETDNSAIEPGEGSVPGKGSTGGNAETASLHRVLRHGTLNLVAQGVNSALNLLVVFVLARGLGKDLLGDYFTIFALIMVVQLVLEGGLGTVLTRRLAQAPAIEHETLSEVCGLLVLIILAGAGVFVGLGAGTAWLRSDPAAFLTYGAAGITCAALLAQRFCAGILYASDMFAHDNFSRVLQGTLFAVWICVLLGLGMASIQVVVAGLAFSHLSAALLLVLGLRHRYPQIGLRWRWPQVKSWLAEAIPLGLGDIARGLTWQMDTILLGLLQPAADVGIYSVAYRPLGPLNWLPRTILTATFPSFVRLAAGDGAALGRAYTGSLRLLFIMGLPIALTLCLCAEPVITVMAGASYLEAALPLRILIWITIPSFLSMLVRYVLSALGQQRTYALLVIPVFALEAIVELALIPHWGYMGACAGTVLGEFVLMAAGLAVCCWLGMGRIEWPALAGSALAGAALGMTLWLAREAGWPLLGLAVFGGLAGYFTLCVLLGALPWDQVRHFAQALCLWRRPAEPPAVAI
jgi:O-antigen/teichoic acid export membrane protein